MRHGDTCQGLFLIGLSPNLDTLPPNLIFIDPTSQREGLGLSPRKPLPQRPLREVETLLATRPHVFINKDGFLQIMSAL